VLRLAPLAASGDHQVVDGAVAPGDEYAGGAKANLDDWYTGMPPGDMHLQLAGKNLLIGVRVAPGDCNARGCALFVAIDENRAATLSMATPFGPEDRGFVVVWTKPSNVQVAQWSGQYPAGQLPPGEVWPATTKVGLGADGKFHVEMKITMRTTSANTQPDPTPRTQPFGLAVAVIGRKIESVVYPSPKPSYYIWPNEPAPTGGQWIALPRYPYTYETIDPQMPTAAPTGFLTYNVGMLPFWRDGGDGTPHDFAAYAADPDVQVACLQEVWDHGQRKEIAALAWELANMTAVGLPHMCGGADDDTCDTGDVVSNMVTESGISVKDTGLLLLSKSPIMASDTLYYKNDEVGCAGADCFEEKGALWARIGTANAKHQPAPTKDNWAYCDEPVYAGEQYIDVFCTHLQAGCDTIATIAAYADAVADALSLGTTEVLELVGIDPLGLERYECSEEKYRKIQKAQIAKLGKWIRNERKGDPYLGRADFTDRPAVVMGDFNINGRSYEDVRLGPMGGSRYEGIAWSFDAYYRTEFEKRVDIYSDRHDIGLGFKSPAKPYPPVRGTDPVLVEEASTLAEDSMPVTTFGESTRAEENAFYHDITGWRYDYIWVLPAWDSDELPFFAIAATPEEPYVVVDLYTNGDLAPASDHAAVFAGIRFVELSELKKYNPMRKHLVTQAVTHIQTLSYDGGPWAGGEDFYGHGIDSYDGVQGGWRSFGAPADEDAPTVFWAMSGTVQPQGIGEWWFDLWEDDPGSGYEDYYDMTPWGGYETSTWFHAQYAEWAFRDSGGNEVRRMCLAGLLANCPVVDTLQPMVKTAGTASESAVVDHQLTVVESP